MNKTILHQQKNYLLRDMRLDDLGGLLEMEKAAHDYPWTKENIESSLASSHHCVVLESAGNLIAYAVSSTAADEAELLNIIVAKPYQGMGIGGVLLECICQSFEKGINTLFLEVRESNQVAIQLYHRLDFNEVGLRPNYYPTKKGREDAIILAKSLI